MKTYYIYHIKGVKIGCSVNPKKRINQQGYYEWEILETHTDIDIASKRELELQKEYGYQIDDIPYKQSFTMQKLADCSAAGKIGGSIAGKKTSLLKIGLHNPDKRKEWSKAGVDALYKKYSAAELKQIRSKGAIKKRKLTPEQLEFIKNNYAPSTNQHNRLPNKMGAKGIAKVLNIPLGRVTHAIKHYI